MGKQVFSINNFGIGEVRTSILTEAQFQEVFDTTWVLMDGRDITGSDLAGVTGNTILPDARGQFLRGKNNGRNDGQEDPTGERAIGNHQVDENKQAGVEIRSSGFSSSSGTDAFLIQTSAPTGSAGGYTDNGSVYNDYKTDGLRVKGGVEARPKNITINYFVKINK